MDFFKKRSTAWAFLAIVIVCSFFIGQARQPAGMSYLMDSTNVLTTLDEIDTSSTKEHGRVYTVRGQYTNRTRPRGYCTVLFLDGHVKAMPEKELMANKMESKYAEYKANVFFGFGGN